MRAGLAVFLVIALAGFMFLESTLAPKAELWPRWQAYSAISRDRIDHRDWDAFLKSYVKPGKDGVNRIPYGRVTETSKKALHAYLDRLRQTPIKLFNRREQKAYWINLYNALTVRLVLEYFPVASIKDIEVSSSPFGGPWDRKLLEIDGEPVSLNDIEHRILRPIWRDPRIHYAVNCASIGCPNLLPVAFTGDNEDTLLELAANAYVNHRRGARIEDGNLIVSKIYGWYAEDFGDSDQGVIAHLRSYGEEPLIKALKGRGTIDDYEYDWKLNGAP